MRCRLASRTLILTATLLLSFGSIAETLTANSSYSSVKPSNGFTTFELAPYSDSSLGTSGAFVELMTWIYEQQNMTLDVKFLPFGRAKLYAAKGLSNGVFPIVPAVNDEKKFYFSEPVFPVERGILGIRGADTSNLQVNIESLDNTAVIGMLNLQKLPVTTNAQIVHANSYKQLLRMLEVKRIDYIFVDKNYVAQTIIDHFPHLIGNVLYSQIDRGEHYYHLALPKNHRDSKTLLDSFNHYLEEAKQSGIIEQILRRYGLMHKRNESATSTVRIATVANSEMKTMQTLSKQFEEEYPNISLDWQIMEENILRKRLMSDLALSEGNYDVLTIGSYETPIWAEREIGRASCRERVYAPV